MAGPWQRKCGKAGLQVFQMSLSLSHSTSYRSIPEMYLCLSFLMGNFIINLLLLLPHLVIKESNEIHICKIILKT